MKSFIQAERELLPHYRDDLTMAKRKSEVEKVFRRMVMNLFEKVSPDNAVQMSSIKLNTKKQGYEIIALPQSIQEAMQDSDLPSIIEKLSKSAIHRYTHLSSHSDRGEFFKR